jgi:plastocyanin
MLRRIGLIATALLLLSAASVSAATRTVNVTGAFPNFSFQPTTTSAKIGDTVKWVNQSSSSHTVTGDAPLNLWNKSLAFNGTASRPFTAAGSFPYHCNFHSSMNGSIAVAMTVSSHSGTTATTFTIRWATVTAPSAFKYIVQKRAPGGSFVAFKSTTSASGTFKTSTKGTWGFRARLKRVSNGAVSNFSPTLTITVS